MNFSDKQNLNILENSIIGYEFEFYSNFDTKKSVQSISKTLNKKIIIETKHHSEFQPDRYTFKVEPDFSGGAKLLELITGPLPYAEARLILIKMLEWIKLNGYTNERCSVHINVSFKPEVVGKGFMTKLDPLKFILDFDESPIYKYFPNRKNSVYAKTIKFIIPNGKFYLANLKSIEPKNYLYPTEKYYGVNFSKLAKNYIEFRYIGGEGYEKAADKILELQSYFLITLYNSIKYPDFSEKNIKEINKILLDYKNVLDSYNNYDRFRINFPDIILTVDNQKDPEIINTYYQRLRDNIFQLLTETTFTKGLLNFDTDLSRIQIKDAEFKAWKLEKIELVEVKMDSSNLSGCDLYKCTITNSICLMVNAFNQTLLEKSKVENSYINQSSVLKNCYVHGKHGVLNGFMYDGIFREGRIGPQAKIGDNVEIIEYEYLKKL